MRRHLANLLTATRLLLAPVFIVLFLADAPWAALGALLLAVVFELTDMLDGYVARHIAGVSSLGKLMDPLADSVARFSIFLAFTTDASVRNDAWPVLLVAVLFYRDAVVAFVRTLAASTGRVLAARTSGKIKAVVQGCGILLFLAVRFSHRMGFQPQDSATLRGVFYLVMIPIALVTALSGIDYVVSNRRAVSGLHDRDEPS